MCSSPIRPLIHGYSSRDIYSQHLKTRVPADAITRPRNPAAISLSAHNRTVHRLIARQNMGYVMPCPGTMLHASTSSAAASDMLAAAALRPAWQLTASLTRQPCSTLPLLLHQPTEG